MKTFIRVIFYLFVLAPLGWVSVAHSQTPTLVQVDPTSSGSYSITGIREFDWQSSGDWVVVNELPAPAIANGTSVTTFAEWLGNAVDGDTVSYAAHTQARLNDVLGLGGISIAPGTLSKNGSTCGAGADCFEITAAGSFLQTASYFAGTVVLEGGTGTFTFFVDSPNSDVSSGQGFADGTAFLTGNVSSMLGSVTNGVSQGDNFISLEVTSYDSNVIETDPATPNLLSGATYDILISQPGPLGATVNLNGTIGLDEYVVKSGDIIRKGDANGEFFAEEPELVAQLGDRVWQDLNIDGIQDCTDGGASGGIADGIIGNNGDAGPECGTGIEGVTVNLGMPTQGECSIFDQVDTDQNGFYRFNNLDAGEYCVVFDQTTLPLDLCSANVDPQFTLLNQGSDAVDSDADPLTGETGTVNLSAGEVDLTVDAGVFCAATPALAQLGDRVWEDLNRNGIQECTDGGAAGGQADGIIGNNGDAGSECGSGIEGVTVNLGIPDQGQCLTFDQTSTDQNGFYQFTDLASGEYCVVFDKTSLPLDFCAADGIDLGAPLFTLKNQGGGAVDSDADPVTGATDSVSLAAGDMNLTVDAGLFCPAKLGDRVWLDETQNGLQDFNEPGVPGIMVNLLDCGTQQDGAPPQNATVLRTTMTEGSDGMYMFGGPGRDPLDPGNYAVEFIKPLGFTFSTTDVGINDAIDSDANQATGRTVCMPLKSREYDSTKDAGLVPESCAIMVDKTCVVPPPPPVSFDKCSGKLQQFTVIWGGSGQVTVNGAGKNNFDVAAGDEVTFFGPFSQNDVEIQLSGAANGTSVFHMSCSDDDFNSPDDCGKLAGNGKAKANGSEFINEWLLEGFVDADGKVLDCTMDTTAHGTDSCTVNLIDTPSCETLGKPDSLTFRYMGNGPVSDCTDNVATMADQKPPVCSGDLTVGATVALSVNDGIVTPTTVAPGQEFTITGFGSNTAVTLADGYGTEIDNFHTSCSAPLEAGDVFGNLQLVGFNGQRSSVNVTYNYEITNVGSSDILNIIVNDDVLGRQVHGSPVLGPLVAGESVILSEFVAVDDTVTNIASVSASTAAGGMCAASDAVTVTFAGPPPCDISGNDNLKGLKDDKIKWKLTNNGSKVATIKSVTVTFPLENGQVKKLKLEGDFFEGQAGTNGSATLDVDDFNKGNLDDRQLKAGDNKEIEIQFTEKYSDKQESDYTITVEFQEGCSVTFAK